MLTLDEAKIIAQEVLSGQTHSYVQAAHDLAEFVASLTPGVNVIEIEPGAIDTNPAEPFDPSPSLFPSPELLPFASESPSSVRSTPPKAPIVSLVDADDEPESTKNYKP